MSHLETHLVPADRPKDGRRALAGDGLLAQAPYSFTHGIDVEAPPPVVWPWQVGDELATTPAQNTFYDVLALEKKKLFVIGGATDRLGGHIEMSWAFVREPIGKDATRVRAQGHPRWSAWLQGAVLFPPLHALMQHAQLENLRHLAEREALARGSGTASDSVR